MLEQALMKLRLRDDIDADEERALRDAVSEVRDVPANGTLVREHVELDASNILLDGFMCRYKELPRGGRQITELHVAGDFVDLHSFPLKRLDHNVLALVDCTVAVVPHARLKAITETLPHLTRLLWLSTTMDAAAHREWQLTLGRRSAPARVAHMLCELNVRLQVVGLSDGLSYHLPLTQAQLAECLGLTLVHVNRTLRDLRMERLVTFRSKRVTIADPAALAALAEFDPAYLYLEKRAR